MTKEIKDLCQDPTQSVTIDLPCALAERVERYAKENKTDVTGVLIEALDGFLRQQE